VGLNRKLCDDKNQVCDFLSHLFILHFFFFTGNNLHMQRIMQTPFEAL
jgi:hypothetical protein